MDVGALPTIAEPTRDRPVLYDVDVVVAGAGLSGTFAAIAAAQQGAGTVLVERLAALGGNMGPAMICGGNLVEQVDITLPGGFCGIPREFIRRVEALRIGSLRRYPEESNIASFVAAEMMQQAGVEVLLSARASDPILDGGRVGGLFVECKGGRVAVQAKTTVDATGDAELALRAGAAIVPYTPPDEALHDYIRPDYMKPQHPTFYNDTLLLSVISNVDLAKYDEYAAQTAELSADDEAWGRETGAIPYFPSPMIPALHTAWDEGAFRPWVEIVPEVWLGSPHRFEDYRDGNVELYVPCLGAIDATDPVMLSRIEMALRTQAFRFVRFYRENVPGFENAYLLVSAPFLGMRGGPHIEGVHTLTPQEAFAGRKCDDVLFRNTHEMDHGGDPSGFDVPYGIALPSGVEGLLVCGRGAAYIRRGHDPSGMRHRACMMLLGQCIGTAAALAAMADIPPHELDVRQLQSRLLAEGIFLGENDRLVELGLR